VTACKNYSNASTTNNSLHSTSRTQSEGPPVHPPYPSPFTSQSVRPPYTTVTTGDEERDQRSRRIGKRKKRRMEEHEQRRKWTRRKRKSPKKSREKQPRLPFNIRVNYARTLPLYVCWMYIVRTYACMYVCMYMYEYSICDCMYVSMYIFIHNMRSFVYTLLYHCVVPIYS